MLNTGTFFCPNIPLDGRHMPKPLLSGAVWEFILIAKINIKKLVYHLVNGCTVLLCIENSKNDRLKVILLVAV